MRSRFGDTELLRNTREAPAFGAEQDKSLLGFCIIHGGSSGAREKRGWAGLPRCRSSGAGGKRDAGSASPGRGDILVAPIHKRIFSAPWGRYPGRSSYKNGRQLR
jgi:hypothetical protein